MAPVPASLSVAATPRPPPLSRERGSRDDDRVSDLRDQFVADFGVLFAGSIEAAIERHVPELKVQLERGSDPFRFVLVWAVGLECLSRPEFRAEHGITVPWAVLRDWIRDADLLAGYDGTFDFGGRAVGLFDEMLGTAGEDDLAAGAAEAWRLATMPAAQG